MYKYVSALTGTLASPLQFKGTALMEACSRGHNSVAILLIRAGTQINFKSEVCRVIFVPHIGIVHGYYSNVVCRKCPLMPSIPLGASAVHGACACCVLEP